MKFTKGLVLDATNEDRPEGTWAHALNALFNVEVGGVTKEGGTEEAWSPGDDLYILGHGTYQELTVIFTFRANLSLEEIFLFDGNTGLVQRMFQSPGINITGSCAERVVAAQFGWDIGTQIKAVLNKNTKDELIVYWICDDFAPCVFNIDRQKALLDAGTIAVTDIYESDVWLTCDVRWIDQFRLAPHAGPVPRIDNSTVIEGGSLDVSTYTLALQYEMDDGSTTGNLLTSLPVAIAISGRGRVITKGSNSFGKDSASIVTGSAIKWELSNINTVNIKYLCPYIIKNSGNAEVGLKLTKIEISSEVDLVNRTIDIVYEGLEGEALADINEIFNGNLVYTRAKAIEQFDDKLYLANLEVDPIFRYQKYANAITLRPMMEDICVFDPQHGWNNSTGTYRTSVANMWDPISSLGYGAGFKNENGAGMAPAAYMESRSYRNDYYYTHRRGYKRGETYAFYIAFIKADGSMSPAYHIPGREHIYPIPSTTQSLPEDVNENWFFQQSWSWPGSNGMNFWKNQDEVYPATTDFDTLDINTAVEVTGISNQNRPVRHHHFPHSHDVNFPGWYVGPSPWAVVQNCTNTNLPLSSLSVQYTNQLYPYAFNYVNRIGGTYYQNNWNNTLTTARIALVYNLNNWTSQLGDPTAWENVGYNIVKLVAHKINGVTVTDSGGSWVSGGKIVVNIPNYTGQANLHYMEIEFEKPVGDLLWTNFWTSGVALPNGNCGSAGCLHHTLNLYDAAGDGWNGAMVNLEKNGSQITLDGTVFPGEASIIWTDIDKSHKVYEFCAVTGDTIDLTNWVSGVADAECSWDIRDGCGNVLGSGGLGPFYASFYGSIAGLYPTGASVVISVGLSATNTGAAGNSILLTGDGATDLDTLVSNWNTANVGNEVQLDTSNGTYIPDNGEAMQLSGGEVGSGMVAACHPDPCTANDTGIFAQGYSYITQTNDADWMNDFTSCIDGDCGQQAVNILGFTLEDLAVPLDIAQQSQGFRIYRGDRLEPDRTRMDQGLKAYVKAEDVKLSNKKPEVRVAFQVPFYGIDGPGYYRNQADFPATPHLNRYGGAFAFYGFECLRTRKILNEVTKIDKIYAFNEASTLSVRGPELWAAGEQWIKFENNTSIDELLTDFSGNVTCYDPWAQGFKIDLNGTTTLAATQAWWGSRAKDVIPSVGSPLFPWGAAASGEWSEGKVGGVALYTGVYHFLATYDQVVNSSDNHANGRLSHTRIGTRLEYIQGNTIESLRDFHPVNYAFNMGGSSYVLGFGMRQISRFPSARCYYDNLTLPSTNPGSMYHNYVPQSIGGGTISYGNYFTFLDSIYNEVSTLLPDSLVHHWNGDPIPGNVITEEAHFQIVDLYAERRNIYNDFDTKDLVWTGYEVLGEEYNRFIVDVDSQTPAVNHSQDIGINANTTGNIFGGDTFIAREYVRITHDGYDLMQADLANTWLDTSAGPEGISTNSIMGIGANCINFAAGMHVGLISFIVESNENIALRHSTTSSTPFAPQSSIHKLLFALDGICIGIGASCFTHLDWTKDDSLRIHTWDMNPCLPTDLTNHETGTNANGEEGIRYNEIYHYNNLMGNPIPVSNSIKEILTYPVRITRSITGGGVSDTYRNFPELDFIDVQTDKGSIWNLFIHTGILMIQSEDGLYKTKGKEQLSTEGGGDIFVGSGNIFTNPPELIATASLGVGGTTLRFSNYSTKWGYFYIDYNRRTVNHFAAGLDIISDKGMREWFQVNIPIEIYEYGIPVDDEYTNTLFGFTLGLDARHNRLLITKRSYTVTAAFITLWEADTSGTGTDVRWNYISHTFEIYNGSWSIITFANSTYFDRDDWTLSYYPEEKIWGSFHSYHPSTYICHDNEIYGYAKPLPGYMGTLYRHNNFDFNRYGVYYDNITHPFEVMQSFNMDNLNNKTFYALNVDTKVVNQAGSVIHNIGLTHYYAHTDVQITGEIALDYMRWSFGVFVDRGTYRGVGGSWQINDLRDRAILASQQLTDSPVIGDHWTLLNLYTQPMFIDNSFGFQDINPLYVSVGAALAVNWATVTAGSGYTPGGYTNVAVVPLSPNSTGTGMTIDFTINGAGSLGPMSINNPGTGYQDGEMFTFAGTGTGAAFGIWGDKSWTLMRRITDRYINIFLKDDNSVKNSLTLLDSSVLYKEYSR